MGGASLYFYLYFVCGGVLLLAAGLATVLWVFGRRVSPRGVATPVEARNAGDDASP